MTTATESGIAKDEVGFYAYWGSPSDPRRRESLRTPDEAKARLWLYRGNCHGATAHDKTCCSCDVVTIEVFKP
jgi:hypothetical protein